MVLGEIGKQRKPYARAVQSTLFDADGGRFQGAIVQALVDKAAQAVLQQHAVRRGQPTWTQRTGLGRVDRGDADTQRAYQSAYWLGAHGIERLGQPPGAGGFAIGTGNCQHLHAARGVLKKSGGNVRAVAFEPDIGRDARILQAPRCRILGIDQAGGSAVVQCLRYKLPCIDRQAGHGNKTIARVQLAVVGL